MFPKLILDSKRANENPDQWNGHIKSLMWYNITTLVKTQKKFFEYNKEQSNRKEFIGEVHL